MTRTTTTKKKKVTRKSVSTSSKKKLVRKAKSSRVRRILQTPIEPKLSVRPHYWLSLVASVFLMLVNLFLISNIIGSSAEATVTDVTSVESESMAWSPTNSASTVVDAAQSNGKFMKMNVVSTGSITTTTGAGQGLRVTAKGDQCSGAPSLQVKLDGKVIGSADVSSSSWTQYNFPTAVTAGSHKIEIGFTNAYSSYFFWVVTCQRTLYLDKTSVYNDVVTTTPEPSPNVAATSAALSSYNGLKGGYDMHSELYLNKIDAYFKLAADGGAKYARDGINWAEFEQTKGKYTYNNFDAMMKSAAKANVHLLLLLGGSPQWETGSNNVSTPPKNPADFANFVTQVVKRYGSNGTFWTENPTVPKVLPVGVEIWNEPNGVQFWGNTTPDPAKYVTILQASYKASKAVDASLPVIAGGLGSGSGYNDINCDGKADSGSDSTGMTGMNYLEAMYKAGAHGYFDAINWHSYIFGNVNAATMMAYAKCSGWSVMQDTTPSIRSFMTQYGDADKKVWITETGYPSCTSSYTSLCLSEAEQGKLAQLQAAAFKTYSWAGLYFWYDLTDDTTGTTFDFEKHMGATHSDYTAKPAYTALKAAFVQ